MKKFKILFLLISVFLFQSCYTYKLNPQKYDQNVGSIDVIKLESTTKKEKTQTLVGKGVELISEITAAGGVGLTLYGGLNLKYLLGVIPVVSCVVVDAIMPESIESKSDIALKKWVKQYNRENNHDYKLYYFSDSEKYYLFPDNAPETFSATNITEIDFYKNNLMTESTLCGFIKRSSKTLNEIGLDYLIKLYPNNVEILNAKKELVSKSNSISLLISSNKKYNAYSNEELEEIAAGRVNSMSKLSDYRQYFGKKTKHDDVILNYLNNILNYQSNTLSLSDCLQLIEFYPNSENSKQLIKSGINLSKNFNDLSRFINFGKDYYQLISKNAISILNNNPRLLMREFIVKFNFSQNLHKVSDYEYYVGNIDILNKFTGYGILFKMSGLNNPSDDNYYIGNFVSGKLDGADSKILLRNGNYLYYQGEAKNNLPNGKGIGKGTFIKTNYLLSYIEDNKNSLSYNGSWSNGYFHGEGVIEGDVTQVFGVYNQGKMNGECTIYWVKRSNKTGGFLGALLSYADTYAGATGIWTDDTPNGTHVVKVQTRNSSKKIIKVSSYSELLDCAKELLSDVIADNRRFDIQKKQQECNDCAINESKSTFPTEAKDFLGFTYEKPGLIRMQNDEEYEFYFQKGDKPWYIITSHGIFSNDTKGFNSFNELMTELVKICKEKRCR